MRAASRSVLLLVVLFSSSARALPAPCSEADMTAQADIVVDADCVSVSCLGAPVEYSDRIETPYDSELWASKGYKPGGFPNSFRMRGTYVQWKTMPPTGWVSSAPPQVGWAGLLYLKKVTGTVYFEKVCWNGAFEDAAKSLPKPYPSCGISDGSVDGVKHDVGSDLSLLYDAMTKDAASVDARRDAQLGPDSPKQDASPPPDAAPLADSHGQLQPDSSRPTSSSSGCSCDTGSRSTGASGLALLLVAVPLTWWSRRRRRVVGK